MKTSLSHLLRAAKLVVALDALRKTQGASSGVPQGPSNPQGPRASAGAPAQGPERLPPAPTPGSTRVERSGYHVEPSQGDGWRLVSPYGHIDYRHDPSEGGHNEIWWVESHRKGHGSQLVDWMQQEHPASSIAWGATSAAGDVLRERWHAKNPNVHDFTSGPFEGQFDPFGHEDDEEQDWDDVDE